MEQEYLKLSKYELIEVLKKKDMTINSLETQLKTKDVQNTKTLNEVTKRDEQTLQYEKLVNENKQLRKEKEDLVKMADETKAQADNNLLLYIKRLRNLRTVKTLIEDLLDGDFNKDKPLF